MNPPRTLRELLLAVLLLALGVIGLPALVFLVGQRILGDYEGGMTAFYQTIGDALTRGNPFAWLLILSPLIVIEFLRVCLWLRRRRRTVN
jgi:hypothetical protein